MHYRVINSGSVRYNPPQKKNLVYHGSLHFQPKLHALFNWKSLKFIHTFPQIGNFMICGLLTPKTIQSNLKPKCSIRMDATREWFKS